jgi:ketopantoate reductase
MAPLTFTDGDFTQILQKAQAVYPTFGAIKCPYFGENVQFNAQDLEHLRRKAWNRGRDRVDQFMRLKHISRAPEILRLSRTVQGIQETHEWERRRRHGQWEKLLVAVTYYEFVAVLDRRRFKVIVKQLPAGDRIFWSLIPFWRQSEQGRRLLHNGNPAQD